MNARKHHQWKLEEMRIFSGKVWHLRRYNSFAQE